MVKKIGDTPEESGKSEKKSIPGSKEFEELMRVDKTSEAEFEKKKKKKGFLFGEEDETKVSKEPPPPSPSQIFYYKNQEDQPEDLNIDEPALNIPKSPQVNIQNFDNKTDEKKIEKGIKTHLINKTLEKIQLEKKKRKEKKALLKEKEEINFQKKKEKLKKEDSQNKMRQNEQAFSLLDFSKEVQLKVDSIMPKIDHLIPNELHVLAEKIIGTIINIEKKGVSTTHIILNNKDFENSRFFGSEIVFEKYATAPNSYNITLMSSNDEAVKIFKGPNNTNLEGLYKTLKKSGLDFELGRLDAVYKARKPLIKRKKDIKDSEK